MKLLLHLSINLKMYYIKIGYKEERRRDTEIHVLCIIYIPF